MTAVTYDLPKTGINDRISPEYLEQQKQLHEQTSIYGTSSGRHIKKVQDLIEEYGATSILDYGCGKGLLKDGLGLGDLVREYDPAIPGKDGDPEPADIVVCTDVLEHIEPEKLPSVIEHIRILAKRCFVFTISTREAYKTLPDGRNAHLIVKDPDWWKAQLEPTWDIREWNVGPNGVGGVARPYTLVGEITGKGVVDDSTRFEYVKQNIRLTKKRIQPAKFYRWDAPNENTHPLIGVRTGFAEDGRPRWAVPKINNRVAILMCYGPSLADTWQDALKQQRALRKRGQPADIISVSGAHDYVIERGIIPKYHIECDPREHKGDMLSKPKEGVEYLMASCCHPNVVKKIKDGGGKLTLWHLFNGNASYEILNLEPHAFLVPGGGSVGLRAIPLLYLLGYRVFHIHGMDCSYRSDEETHAGKHTGKRTDKVEVLTLDRRKFLTSPVLITYKRYFFDLCNQHSGNPNEDPTKIEVYLFGDGLMNHWFKLSNMAKPVQKEAA